MAAGLGQGLPWDGSRKDLWFSAPWCLPEKSLSADGVWHGLLGMLGTVEVNIPSLLPLWFEQVQNKRETLKQYLGCIGLPNHPSPPQETSAGLKVLAYLTWCTALTASWASSPSPINCSCCKHGGYLRRLPTLTILYFYYYQNYHHWTSWSQNCSAGLQQKSTH